MVLMATLVSGQTAVLPEVREGVSVYSSGDVVGLIVYVTLALVFSFLCSIAEAVLLSITPTYIEGLKEKHPKLAGRLKILKQDKIDQSLAGILTLNTIAHTVGAIGAGSKATTIFGSAWFGLFSAIMTLLILFLSEIIPKTLGAVHWRALARPTTVFVQGLIYSLYPLIWLSEKLTQLLSHGKEVHHFSRDEFVAMAGLGESAGHLNQRESRIIKNLFRFDSIHARDIMTPRTVILAFPEMTSVEQALQGMVKASFSRIPIYSENRDQIKGFVMKDDMLLAKAEGRGDTQLTTLKRDIFTVTSKLSLSGLLEFLLDHRQHIALVVGEYGETEGLVTLEDVVETLLGLEIVDEKDKVEDMQKMAREKWLKRAQALGLDVEGMK